MRAIAEESARRTEPDDHDYVRSGWLLGAALVASVAVGSGEAGPQLDEAERYLASAWRLQKTTDALVEGARRGGGPDNITVALVRPHFDIPARVAHRIEQVAPRLGRLFSEGLGLRLGERKR